MMLSSGMLVDEGAMSSLPRSVTPGPPPAYESLIFGPQSLPSPSDYRKDSLSPLGSIYKLPQVCTSLPYELEASRGHYETCNCNVNVVNDYSNSISKEISAANGNHHRVVIDSRDEDEGLPSYEAALKLEAQGYVWMLSAFCR